MQKNLFTQESIDKIGELTTYIQGLGLSTYTSVQNTDLFLSAFIHKSYACDYVGDYAHNERLEFLGDGILGAIVNKFLFMHFANEAESKLTLYKISLVREETLAEVAREINLDKHIFLGNGEDKQGGRQKNSVLSDCLEAFIGYLYMDQPMEVVEDFVHTYVCSKLNTVTGTEHKSYKSLLQELVQKIHKQLPQYDTAIHTYDEFKNPSLYSAKAFVRNKEIGYGVGKNKKTAEELAAQQAYESLVADHSKD